MKKTKQVIAETNIPAKLIRSVVRQIGSIESLEDVARHGADAGFSGFTYYSDTCAFYKRNKNEILQLASEQSQEFGTGMLEMIANFGCLSSGSYPNRKPDYSVDEIGEAIYSGRGDCSEVIQNAMAWFALEEVARAFCPDI